METTIKEEGEGSPGTRAEAPLQLQPVVKAIVIQIVPLQPVEDWEEAGIHIAACERSHTRAGDDLKKAAAQG